MVATQQLVYTIATSCYLGKLTSTFRSIRSYTTSKWPLDAADISGVMPTSFWALNSALC